MESATTREDGTAIALRGVGRTYGTGPSSVEALRSVDLSIPWGELVVVLGPSGSGKTTLLNLVGALESPTRGEIEAAGRELGTLDEAGRTAYRRDEVGFVFQFYNLVPTLTALENVALVLELTGRGGAEHRAREALEVVGLADRVDRFPAQLSGGEQQRVAVARALAKEPRLVLCDEPTGALDLDTGRIVLGLLRMLLRERRTVLLVTHNSAIAEMADRVVRLRSGIVVADEHVRSPIDADEVTW